MLGYGNNKLLALGFRPRAQTICDGIQNNVLGFIVTRIDQDYPTVRCLEPVITDIGGNENIRFGANRIFEQIRTAAAANRDTLHFLTQ